MSQMVLPTEASTLHLLICLLYNATDYSSIRASTLHLLILCPPQKGFNIISSDLPYGLLKKASTSHLLICPSV
jgi:hypothetical protein